MYSATNLPTGLTISSTTGLISGTIASGDDTSSPYAVTVTATDSAGLSATQSFNWTAAPVSLVNPGSQSSVDNQAVSLALQGSSGATYTATGLPSGLSISSSGLISGTLASNADMSSPYVVTVTATLGSNSTSQSFLWTVTPVGLASVSDQTNTEGDNVSLQLQGMSNGGSLTYNASGLPDGLSLNSTTGLITGTIVAGDAANSPYTVDVSVSNGTVSASQSFNWAVNPVVNLTTPADESNNEGDTVSLQLSATDALNNALTYSATGLPPGLSISTTGLISGTISTGDAANGPYAATVTASDGTYSSSSTFTWNVTHTDTTALTMTAPGGQTNVAGDSVNLQINAGDPDGIDTLTYTATGLPDGLSIDPYLGTISGIVADDAVSTTPYQVTVTATDGNGQSVSQTFSWLVNATDLTATASPVSAVEGNDTGSLTVATFTTTDLNSQAGDFTATVNWGDGNSDIATVSGSNGSFTVTDDHTFAEAGTYPVSITIVDGVTGASATATTTATVTDAPLTLTGGFQLGVLQQQSNNLTLATFTDGNPNAAASDFTATINWGDGSGTQSATVSDSNGVFSINGTHSFSQNGTYTATITVTDADGATQTATSTIVVGTLYAGIQSNLTVASFTDGDTSAPASSFTATINWGDGSSSSGTVTGSNGVFSIQGTHTYAVDSFDNPGGVFPLTVTVSDASGETLTSNGSVAVVRPPMSGLGDNVAGQPGVVLNNVQVAEFTVPDATDDAGEFSATINWSDGTIGTGTIQEVSPGLFQVLGSHAYAMAGQYTIQVEVSEAWDTLVPMKVIVAECSVGANQLQLRGPTAVPGNSEYTYLVPIPSTKDGLMSDVGGPGANGEPVWNISVVKINGEGAIPYILREGITDVGTTNQKALYAVVEFPNVEPLIAKISVQFTVNSVDYTKSLDVALVQIVLTPIGEDVPELQAREVYGLPATGAANPANGQAYKVITVQSGGLGDPTARIIPGKNPPPGINWQVGVTLIGPDGGEGVNQISVGFIQHVTVTSARAFYPKVNGQPLAQDTLLRSPVEGQTALDVASNADYPMQPPWYAFYTESSLTPASSIVKNQFANLEGEVSQDIGSYDSPAIQALLTEQGKAPNQNNQKEINYIQDTLGFYRFALDIVANTQDSGVGANMLYWRQATANWMFNFSGRVNIDPNLGYDDPQRYTWIPLSILGVSVAGVYVADQNGVYSKTGDFKTLLSPSQETNLGGTIANNLNQVIGVPL